MRGAKDPDFGIQVVGCILRVHRHLQAQAQAKTLPELKKAARFFLSPVTGMTRNANFEQGFIWLAHISNFLRP